MKKIMLALALTLVSFASMAQMVFPHVYNNRTYVTFDAWNTSPRSVTCRGVIYLDLSENRRETISVYEYLWPRGSAYRTYYITTPGAIIEYASHSVSCY